MILREGIIRKVSIGADLKDAMFYQVGKKVNGEKYTITKIQFSDEESFMYDCIILHIYVSEGNGEEFVWKSLVDFQNLNIEYTK